MILIYLAFNKKTYFEVKTMNDQIEQFILENLLEQIENKEFTNQSIFPSENKLAELYNVSRIKIRHVLIKLEEMGYLCSQQEKGRFLKQHDKPIDLLLSGDVSFTEKMTQAGYRLETNNHSCEKIPFDSELYKKLNIEQSDEVFKISRLRMIDGEPAAIHQSYVAKSIFPQIETEGPFIQSMFTYYQQKGFTHFSSDRSHLRILFSKQEERKLLQCAPLVPLLVVETNCKDIEKSQLLEYTKIFYRSDIFTYSI